jgi:1-deoxy-D-xylulose-5-phosphate reductoisomerase
MVSGASALDFTTMAQLSFESVHQGDHPRRFAGLQLAWDVLEAAPGMTAVLNAANEVAVEAFLQERIRFDQIHALNLATLNAYTPAVPGSLADLLEIDATARRHAHATLGCWAAA